MNTPDQADAPDCQGVQAQLQDYFEDRLQPAVAVRLQAHLEACPACQRIELVEPQLAAMLRARLEGTGAPVGLAARIRSQLDDASAASPQAGSARSALARFFGSPWGPRLALAAMLVVLLLLPFRGWFQAPALARSAAASHEVHCAYDGPGVPPCCTRLDLRAGDVLDDPSAGIVIPDLSAEGLELISVTRCDFEGDPVHILSYRSAGDGSRAALYVTNRLADRFRTTHRRTRAGQLVAVVRHHAVTMWESAGVVCCWVGPSDGSDYASALADLERELQH